MESALCGRYFAAGTVKSRNVGDLFGGVLLSQHNGRLLQELLVGSRAEEHRKAKAGRGAKRRPEPKTLFCPQSAWIETYFVTLFLLLLIPIVIAWSALFLVRTCRPNLSTHPRHFARERPSFSSIRIEEFFSSILQSYPTVQPFSSIRLAHLIREAEN